MALRALVLVTATFSAACWLPAESEPDDEDEGMVVSEQAIELSAVTSRVAEGDALLGSLAEMGTDAACSFVSVPEPDVVIDDFSVAHELRGIQAGTGPCERFVVEIKAAGGGFRWLKISNAAVPVGMCGGDLDHGICDERFDVRAELWKRSCAGGSCSSWELQVFDPRAEELQCNGLQVAECDLMYRGYVTDAEAFDEFRLALKAERSFDDGEEDWFVDVGLYRDRPDRRKL
jgi:hypothetical protein